MMKVNQQVNELSVKSADISSKLFGLSQEVVKSSTEIASAVNTISDGSTSQSQSIQNTYGIVEDMSQKLVNVYDTINRTMDLSNQTREANNEVRTAVNMLAEKSIENYNNIQEISNISEELNTKLQSISSITNTITQIAGQTNMLALNASIEAARAGEQGAGFSVVAQEVKSLSNQSSKFIDEIKVIVADILMKSEQVSNAMVNTMKIVEEQNNAVKITEDSFSKIYTYIDQIISGINDEHNILTVIDNCRGEVVNNMSSISGISQETASNIEEVSSSIEDITSKFKEIFSLSETLSNEANELKSVTM
jgi:methyl-accepting chemotaxis protein